MILNIRCKECNEPSKYIVGLWDGPKGTHGIITDCRNSLCEIKQLMNITEEEAIKNRIKVQEKNGKNHVYVLALETKRKTNKITIKNVAKHIGCTPSEYCDYIRERVVMPYKLYFMAEKYITSKKLN